MGPRRPLTPPTELSERDALLLLRLLPGVGDRRGSQLLLTHGSARAVLAAPEALAEAGARRAAAALADPDLRATLREISTLCSRHGIVVRSLLDEGYPRALRELHDPPPVLFLRGREDLFGRAAVAIVGSRRSTATGRRVAERLARDLSRRGVAVVSGLALGVDGAAHRGALDGPGGTIAVLGRGPDRAYPRTHHGLFTRIVDEGLVVSEFPPGEPVRPHNFPRRNRVLAGLANGVVVVEAGRVSGALLTTDHALDLGRPVMAVPGSVEIPQNEGCHKLLRTGAELIRSADDVMECLRSHGVDLSASIGGEESGSGASRRSDPFRDAVGASLTGLLGEAPQPLEDLLDRCGLPPSLVLAALTRLELDGQVRRAPEGWSLGSP